MGIAQIAPLFESVPPRLYGGTERVVSCLTEELVNLGHEVTLFASAGRLGNVRGTRSVRQMGGLGQGGKHQGRNASVHRV